LLEDGIKESMNKLKVKTESLLERCETCHQSDFFDAVKNYCSRCKTNSNNTVVKANDEIAIHHNKKSLVYKIVLLIISVIPVFFFMLLQPATLPMPLLPAIICLMSGFFFVALFAGAWSHRYYSISSSVLGIYSYYKQWPIAISSIEEVKPSSKLSSALATFSLTGIEITFRLNDRLLSVVISPQDNEAFLHDLANKSPHLMMRGDSLICISKRS